MFICNLKLNKKVLCRIFIVLSLFVVFFIILYSFYVIFFKKSQTCDSYKNNIIDLNESNYTNILKAANENIDSYIGVKVRVIGYVYRLIDFNESQFVVARDMKLNNSSQSLIVGFLCESKNASKYSDGTWVEVIGKIKRGKLNEELAILDVTSIREVSIPEHIFVNPPGKGDSSLFQPF